MGLTYVTVSVANLANDASPYQAEFLVDTGAIHCMAAGDELAKAGIQVEGKAVYELANVEPVEYEHGFARITFLGDETVAKIIFGPPGVEPILGVVALESTGIVVDPITQNLKRLHALPLK
jgi:predicted aspartyl protease